MFSSFTARVWTLFWKMVTISQVTKRVYYLPLPYPKDDRHFIRNAYGLMPNSDLLLSSQTILTDERNFMWSCSESLWSMILLSASMTVSRGWTSFSCRLYIDRQNLSKITKTLKGRATKKLVHIVTNGHARSSFAYALPFCGCSFYSFDQLESLGRGWQTWTGKVTQISFVLSHRATLCFKNDYLFYRQFSAILAHLRTWGQVKTIVEKH